MKGLSPPGATRRPLWRRLAFAPLTIAAAVGVVFGVVEPVPLDLVLRQIQSNLMPVPASGEIVIVEASGRDNGGRADAGEPRRLAELLDALAGYKPKQVFVEQPLTEIGPIRTDDPMVASSEDFARPVIMAKKVFEFSKNLPETAEGFDERHSNIAVGSTTLRSNAFGYVEKGAYFWSQSALPVPSFASLMAGRTGRNAQFFFLENRVRTETIPSIDASNILTGRLAPNRLANKTILIASTTAEDDPVRLTTGVRASEAVTHVLAAETLLRGRPRDWGWLPLLSLVLVAEALVLRFVRRSRSATLFRLLGLAAILAALAIARLWLINLDAAPALAAMATAAWLYSWRRKKARAEQTNIRSGLPNMTAFRAVEPPAGSAVVVARVARHDEIMTAVPADLHGAFARAVAARLTGGDESRPIFHDDSGHFAWFQPALSVAEVECHVSGLKALFGAPVELGDRRIDVELAFGVDLNEGRSTPVRLSSATDAASEAADRGEVAHSAGADRLEQAQWRASLHSAIDTALANEEIWVAYQPQLDLAAGEVVGAEALVRWSHPTRGDIPPSDFIDHAERDGRIDSLTWAVLDHAVSSAALINDDGAAFGVSVNLSAVMLSRPHLHTRVMANLAAHRLPAGRLTLELTETVPLGEDRTIMDNLTRLRAAGVRISIDDYGTGASNLVYLRSVPSDEIKIDKTFVTGLPSSPENTAIVRGTIDMVHALGRTVVAEGVEDMDTLRLLGTMGCDLAQGYAIARPQRLDDFRRLFGRRADARFVAFGRN